jgi:predicted alpha/beta superfamily hydrolase
MPFALHISPSATLVNNPSVNGAVFYVLSRPNPSPASPLATELLLHPATPPWAEHPYRVPDDEASIPRLETWHFHSKILPEPDHRAILVYLPEEYAAAPDRRFPVFYLHDGQNLFDPRTSYVAGRTWQAGSTTDRMTEEGNIEPVILVGIANSGVRRMAEYTPTRDAKMGGGEGRSYGRMLIEELKLFVDSTYRTRTGPQDTALGGSSLGGLISFFLGLECSAVFGKVAVMSPSIWWNYRSILGFIHQAIPKPPLKIWLDMGTAEGMRHVRDTELVYRMLLRLGWRDNEDLAFMEVEGAVHDEDAWAKRFDHVLRFLFPPTA